MDGHAKATGDEANDGVTRQRRAALRELDGRIVEAFDHDTIRRMDLAQVDFRQVFHALFLGGLELLVLLFQLGQTVRDGHAAIADGRIQLLSVVLAHPAAAAVHEFVQLTVRDENHLTAQLLSEGVTALLDVFIPAHLLEPVANFALRLAGADDLQPVAAGAFVRRTEDDFDDFTRRNDMLDGDHPVVDLTAHHPVTDGGVDGIRKVDAGRTGRQVDDVALRGKGEDFFGQQIALEVVQQVSGILADALVFQQLTDPRQTLIQLVVTVQAFLVLPVGGDAVLGLFIHLPGADLHLKGDALVTNDGGVQALVAVGLRGRDIVLEAVRQRMVHIVDETEGAVTLRQRIQNDADGVDIVNFIERLVLHDGLPVDAVDALDAAFDGRALDAALLETMLDDAGHAGKELLTGTLAQHLVDLFIAHRVEVVQTAVFQLFLDVQDAEAVGDGRVDFHRLTGLVAAFLLRPCVAGAHIVQPVAQFDDHDADIPAHRQQHLAQVLRLQLLDVRELNFCQLGDAVHQQSDFLAKGGFQVVQRRRRILHDIVEQRGGNALGVHAEVQHQTCNGQRMADIRLTAPAADALVGLVRQIVRLVDHLHIIRLAAGLDGLDKFLIGDDLRAHLGRQSSLRRIGRQCGRRHRGRLLHRLMQMGLCRIGIFFLHRCRCGRGHFLSLWHLTFPPNISRSARRQGSSFLPSVPVPRT